MKLFIIITILVVTLRLISPITADLSFLILAFYAALGGKNTIYSFILCWFLTLINPIIAADTNIGMMGRYLVIIAGYFRVFIDIFLKKNTKINQYIFITSLISVSIIFHSIFFSNYFLVSFLKIFSWILVFSTLFSCWNNLDEKEKNEVFNNLVTFLKGILILSIPFLASPAIGFAKNGTGFQGLLNHPQAFGPTVAILGIIVGGKILANKEIKIIDFIVFSLCLVFVILSEARTAGLGLALGLLFGMVLNPIFNKKSFLESNPIFKNAWIYLYFFILIFFSYIFSNLYINKLQDYLFKRTESSNLFEAAESSRGNLVENMLINIENNPLTGIGFGMSSNPVDMKIEFDPFFNIPISAVIEKGVLPIAVLEELGLVLGILIFFWFILSFYRSAQVDVQKLCMIICIVCLNLGEYMFFSVGGMGMLMLIFFTFSVVLRKKSESI